MHQQEEATISQRPTFNVFLELIPLSTSLPSIYVQLLFGQLLNLSSYLPPRCWGLLWIMFTAPVTSPNIATQTNQRNLHKPPISIASPLNGASISRSSPKEREGSGSGSAGGERASMEATTAEDRQLFVFCDPVTTHAALLPLCKLHAYGGHR